MEGSFEIKKVINKRAYMAAVQLHVEHVRSSVPLEIDLGPFTQWKNAIFFAAEYFLDKHPQPAYHGLLIQLKIVNGHSPDTNNTVVFYAVISALYQAFQEECPVILDDSGNFIVPK